MIQVPIATYVQPVGDEIVTLLKVLNDIVYTTKDSVFYTEKFEILNTSDVDVIKINLYIKYPLDTNTMLTLCNYALKELSDRYVYFIEQKEEETYNFNYFYGENN